MTSVRHKSPVSGTDSYLDAAREALIDVGWSRTTLTDIARRAEVSRMTLYRAWPDMGSLLRDLMTREWSGLVTIDLGDPDHLRRITDAVTGSVRAIRDNAMFRRIVELDPEVLLPYLLQRSGRSQDLVLDLLTVQVREGQRAGQLRGGEPSEIARALVLAAHGFVLSAHTLGDSAVLDAELRTLVARYLAP